MTNKRNSSLTELYKHHVGPLIRSVCFFCGDWDLACDAVSEAFARALEGWNYLEKTNELRPWLKKVAKNYAIDEMNRRRRFLGSACQSSEARAEDPSATAIAKAIQKEVRHEIESLRPEYKEVLSLYYD